jgi:MFS family permease
MLFVFATFFVGSIIRPLGGFLCGMIGDKFGYKFIINLCVILMGISTFLVALLPTYDQIGVFAPIILVLLRLLQGISAGGQFPSLITVGVNDHKNRQGMAVGFIFSISSLGFLLATIVGSISEYFFHNDSNMVWRFPFILSAVLFVIYIWINRKEDYSKAEKPKAKKHNVILSLLKQWPGILTVVLLTTMCASLYFLVFTYLVNYQIDHLNMDADGAFLLNSIILFLACVMYPIFGYMSDRVGHIKVFTSCLIVLFIGIYPLLYLFDTKEFFLMLIGLSIFTMLMATIQGAISPYFSSVFKAEWQATACAVSYSIGNGISGSAPLVASIFVHYMGHYGLTLYVFSLVIIGTIGALFLYFIKPNKVVA